MDNFKETTQKSLNISEEVITAIVKSSVAEMDGVHSLTVLPPKYNFVAAAAAKAISIKYVSDSVCVNIAIVIGMNNKIKTVCERVQQEIKDAVQNMAGVTVSKVNVYVRGVYIPA